MRLGSEFAHAKSMGLFQRVYIWIFGMPILGLRIRAWRVLPIIKKYVTNSQFILDFGSGRGVFTVQIAKQNPQIEVLGVDLIESKVADANFVAESCHLRNCHFEFVDLFKREFNKPIDAVIAIDVLEHIENDLEITKKIHGILTSGGKFIVHVPHYHRHFFGFTRINFDIEGHVRPGYLLGEIEGLLGNAGFKVLEKGYTYSSLETIANDLSYMITQGRERHKIFYALCFPGLLCLAWMGRFVTPRIGSGVYIVGEK